MDVRSSWPKRFSSWQDGGTKEVTFIVGGPNGVSAELSARANKRWSLSRLTLTHEMARVVLLEQLYRAYTIIHGSAISEVRSCD